MNIFEPLEKLINEHGSATILKERLGLAKDKYEALERANDALKIEVAALKAELDQAKREIQSLQELAVQKESDKLDEVQERILVALWNVPLGFDGPDVRLVAGELNISEQVAQFHLVDMERANLVDGSYSSVDPTTWRIGQRGRRYLISRALVK